MRRLALALALLVLACGRPAPPAAPAPEPIPEGAIAALPAPYNSADYAAGRAAFLQCRSCHALEAAAPPRVGPHLAGLIGREAGGVEGYAYSPALAEAAFVWDTARLDAWLSDPQGVLPGNRMAFSGIVDEDRRRDLIAYLMVAGAAAPE